MRSGYRLIKRIGAGSYGNVYLVVDPATGVEWALKVERPSNNVASVKAVVKPKNGGGGGVLANAKDSERSGGGGGGGGTKRKTGVAVEALLEARIILELRHPNVVHTRSVQFDDVNPSMIASVSELGQLTLREYLACDHRDDMETELGGVRASRRTRASATASDRAHRPSSIPPRAPGKSRRRRRRRRSRLRRRESERQRGDRAGGGDADFFDDDEVEEEEEEAGEEDEEPFVAVPLDRTVFWERLAMMRGLVAGMHYFHGKNVAHFDLKPDNILLFARLVYAAGAVLMQIAATRDVGDRDGRKPSGSATAASPPPPMKRAESNDGKSSAATKRDAAETRGGEKARSAAAAADEGEDEDAAAKARWKGPEWDAKHADFGLAELVTGLTPDQPIGGTSSHRAPEILRPLSNTRAWPFAKDYWSMLVVIWSALFCCHPFVSGSEFSRISDELHVLALVFARLGRPSDVWIRMNVDADAQRELAAAERVARLRRERRDERRRAKAAREKAAAAAAAAAEKRANGPTARPVAKSRSVAPVTRAETRNREAAKRRDSDHANGGGGAKNGGHAATTTGPNGGRRQVADGRAGDARKKPDDGTVAAADDTSSSGDDDDETLPTSTFGAADFKSSDGAADQMRVVVALLEMRTGVSYNTWCAAYGTPVMHALMRMFAFGFVYAADARVLDFEPVWHASGLPERPPPPPPPASRHDVGRQDLEEVGSSSGTRHATNDEAALAPRRPRPGLAEKRGATAATTPISSGDAKNATAPPPPPPTPRPPAPRYPTLAPLDDSKLASWFESEKRRLPAPIAKSIWEIWTVLTLLGRAKTKPIVSYAGAAADARSRSPDRSSPSLRAKRGSAPGTKDAVRGAPSAPTTTTTTTTTAESSDGKVPSPTTSEYCAILSLATKLAGFKDDLKFFGRMRDRPARTLESMYARQNEIIAALFTVRFSESWVADAKRREQAASESTLPPSPSTSAAPTVSRAVAATNGMWPVDPSVASHQVATMSAKLSASSRGSAAAAAAAAAAGPSKAVVAAVAVADTDVAVGKSTDRTATAAAPTPKNSRLAEDGAHKGATKTSTARASGRGTSKSVASTPDPETKVANRAGAKKADGERVPAESAAVRGVATRRGATGSAVTRSRKGRIANPRNAKLAAAAADDNGVKKQQQQQEREEEEEEDERDREFGGTRLGYRSKTVEVTDDDDDDDGAEDDWHARVARADRR